MMEDAFWPVLMLIGLMGGIFAGYPVAFVLAGIGICFAVLAGVPMLFLSTTVSRMYSGILTNWLLIAIPLFVFMGLMLERSGIAEMLTDGALNLVEWPERIPGLMPDDAWLIEMKVEADDSRTCILSQLQG